MSDLGTFDDPAEQPDEIDSKPDDTETVSNPFSVGDPVMDATQGRSMVVLEARDQTVAEWSEANSYDLTDNYGNQKFDVSPDEPVVKCAFTSNVKSEPSRSYTYPVSRVRLIDSHNADDGRRIGDRVVVELLESLFGAALDADHTVDASAVSALAGEAGVDSELVKEAAEVADASRLTAESE